MPWGLLISSSAWKEREVTTLSEQGKGGIHISSWIRKGREHTEQTTAPQTGDADKQIWGPSFLGAKEQIP